MEKRRSGKASAGRTGKPAYGIALEGREAALVFKDGSVELVFSSEEDNPNDLLMCFAAWVATGGAGSRRLSALTREFAGMFAEEAGRKAGGKGGRHAGK